MRKVEYVQSTWMQFGIRDSRALMSHNMCTRTRVTVSYYTPFPSVVRISYCLNYTTIAEEHWFSVGLYHCQQEILLTSLCKADSEQELLGRSAKEYR